MSVYVSSLLTATAATVNADPASTRTWQWQRNGVNIPGATNSTYSAAVADIGSNLFVVQTETNFLGSNNASASVGPVVAFSPIALFQDGSQGWWYDDDDLTTLFQDSAGTTPVTAVEQFVGLQLDKSKGLVLGPELVVGSASTYTGNGTVNTVGNTITATCTVNGIYGIRWTSAVVSNVWTQCTFEVVTNSASKQLNFYPNLNHAGVNVGTGVGAKSYILFAPTATGSSDEPAFFITGLAGESFSVRLVSIRELPGNHRYQTTSGSRPVWSKRVNLLTKTEQFDDAVWTKGNATITANATTAPDGTSTADKLVENTGVGVEHFVLAANATISAANTLCTSIVYVKAAERTRIQARAFSNGVPVAQASFNLSTLQFSGISGGTWAYQDAGGGWYRISVIVTHTSSSSNGVGVFLLDASGNLSYTGDGTSGIFIWGADLRPTNQATGLLPLYQRVNTSTDYETTGFPGYLKADGSNDFMQTNSIDFTATDKITLCAGVRKLSDATGGMLIELDSNATLDNNFFDMVAPAIGATYGFESKGTVPQGAVSPTNYAAPISNVVTGQGNIGADQAILRVNGNTVAANYADQGTGNYRNDIVYFFRSTIGGGSFFFNGQEYSSVGVGKFLTADQVAALELYTENQMKLALLPTDYQNLQTSAGDNLTDSSGLNLLYAQPIY